MHWTVADAETALAAGDVEGTERILVALVALVAAGAAGDRRARRATVVETW